MLKLWLYLELYESYGNFDKLKICFHYSSLKLIAKYQILILFHNLYLNAIEHTGVDTSFLILFTL